jgi:hypothetical protein
MRTDGSAGRLAALFDQARRVDEIDERKRLLAEIYAELKSLRPNLASEQVRVVLLELLAENIKLRYEIERADRRN